MQHPKAVYQNIYTRIGYLPHPNHRNPSRLDSILGGLALAVFGSIFYASAAVVSLVVSTAKLFVLSAMLSWTLVVNVRRQGWRSVPSEVFGLLCSLVGMIAGLAIALCQLVVGVLGWLLAAATIVWLGLCGRVMRIAGVTVVDEAL